MHWCPFACQSIRVPVWHNSQDNVSTNAMHLPDVDQILLSYTTLAEWSNSSGIEAPRVQVSVRGLYICKCKLY